MRYFVAHIYKLAVILHNSLKIKTLMKFNIIIFLTTILLSFQCVNGQDRQITKIESVQSLYIESFFDSQFLGSATGFIIKSKTQNYLITNWHVATNKDPNTEKWINPNSQVSPNKIKILQNSKILGEYSITEEELIAKNGSKLFSEFKINNSIVDVVAIPIKDTISNVKLYPVNYNKTSDSIIVMPTDRVFVLGFPKGFKSAPALPIWKSGLIASEPDIDQEGKPIIWIDILGYGGMSGSPVYLITDKLNYKNGSSSNLIGGTETFFMGVFSHGQFDISTGALWKGTYLKSLFNSLP
ncbi:S1 family peptidase [Flavobacterium yafengii]|uniref:S1 family peptidase n=1 Tax=Flavobacterium yafengii TaxID=3041253 RepID=UPI0024A941A5|nr:serine protease [Flavobacterium yafengii]MDI6047954.1 serine protease [Flavobacterium yafengii]